MTLSTSFVVAVAAPVLSFVALARTRITLERLRAAAAACAAACALLCVAAIGATDASLRGEGLLRISELSAPLLPLPSTLWLVSVAVTPKSRLDRAGLVRTAAATLSATLAFSTERPVLLVALWIVSNLLFVTALDRNGHARARRVAGRYLWASAALFAAGAAASELAPQTWLGDLGLWLVVAAIAIRKGIFPFHAWIPEVFESGRIGPIVRFSAPQLGSYVAVVLVVPRASSDMLRVLAVLSLLTSVYGAALALVQRDARRACGYLFVSQSALVLAGLDCGSAQALAGSLVLWLSSALAFTGLTRAVLALEVRRGRLDLGVHHGGYEDTPLLAVSFLVLGMACTGFPGTLGFVGQEMLIEGAVSRFPMLGFFVVVAAALTGLAVLRMYFSLFCGKKSAPLRQILQRREVVAFGAMTALLVLGGLLPRTIVVSRMRASHAILDDAAGGSRARIRPIGASP